MKSFHSSLLSSLILAVLHIGSFGQNFQWAKQIGGTGWDEGTSIKTDRNNNVYTVGLFMGTVDFDPGIGVFNLTSVGEKDAFICKLDASGNFLWAKQYGDSAAIDEKSSLGIDSLGNLYTTNSFLGTVDFDPGAGSFYLTTPGWDRAIFVQKLDANGNFIWTKQITGQMSPFSPNPTHANAIAVDASGNLYITGYFDETIDFDPDPISTFNMIAQSGASDIFICKLDADGNFVWAKQFGSTPGQNGGVGYAIAIDGSGNVYSTGTIGGTIDFDPGPGTFSLTTSVPFQTEIYISKLDPSGNFVWAKPMGPGIGKTIAVDDNSNVYASGWVPSGYTPVINKLNSSGNLVWAKQLGGSYGVCIALDNNKNVYTTGICWGTNDFDSGPGIFNLTGGNSDSFISKVDSSGNFVWAGLLYGTNQVWVQSLSIDKSNNIYTTGYFNGTVDFDPSPFISNLISSAIGYDIFIHKLSPNNVGLSENSFEKDIKIYPNPTTGVFNIAINNLNSSELNIFIFDIQGKEVYREFDKTITNDYNKQLNLSKLSKGIYYVKLNTGTESSIQKLVIQ